VQKTSELEKKLKQQTETNLLKDTKILELQKEYSELENTISELRNQAEMLFGDKKKVKTEVNLDEIRKKIEETKLELETESQRNCKELNMQNNEIDELRAKFQLLNQVNFYLQILQKEK